jgi:hypothetical protein
VEPDPLYSDTAATTPSASDGIDYCNHDKEDVDPPELEHDRVSGYPVDWRRILRRDVIAKVRALVNACRKSPQRRESLLQHIAKGRETGKWNIKSLQLLRDVDTRWSSVYLMIERYLYLHPVCL